MYQSTNYKQPQMTTMTPGDRIKKAREAAGLTQKKLGQAIGLTQQQVFLMEVKGKMQYKYLDIEIHLGLPLGYLRMGGAIDLPQPLIARCPLLNYSEAAFWPENREDIKDKKILKTFAKDNLLGKDCYALKIKDNSMLNQHVAEGFSKDKFIIIDPDKPYKNEDYVVFKYVTPKKEGTQEIFFRQYINDAGMEYLTPLNLADYKRIELTDDIKICGVAVAYLDILN